MPTALADQADPDGLWLHRSVAEVLNAKDGEDLRLGFRTEIINSRGVQDGKVVGINSGDYYHLHLAQHPGLDDNGHRSYLLFGRLSEDTPTDDFICYDSEITLAPLQKTKSVVATACLTLVTHPALNEYLGLAGAFLHAGVETFNRNVVSA